MTKLELLLFAVLTCCMNVTFLLMIRFIQLLTFWSPALLVVEEEVSFKYVG